MDSNLINSTESSIAPDSHSKKPSKCSSLFSRLSIFNLKMSYYQFCEDNIYITKLMIFFSGIFLFIMITSAVFQLQKFRQVKDINQYETPFISMQSLQVQYQNITPAIQDIKEYETSLIYNIPFDTIGKFPLYYLFNVHGSNCAFKDSLSINVEYVDIPSKQMKMICMEQGSRDLYFLSLEDQNYIFDNYESIYNIIVEIDQ